MLTGFNNGSSFDISTQVGLMDYFTGDGVTTSFPLTNKSYLDTGSTIQVGNSQIWRNSGGFSGSGNTLNFAAPPTNGAVISVPATIRFQIGAYGQAAVVGLSNPNIAEAPFFLADISEIASQTYQPTIGQTAILIQPVDNDSIYGALATWIELAPMLADGTAGSYGSAGAVLSETAIEAADNLASGISALATSITVADGSQFTAGRFLMIDAGVLGQQDIVQVLHIASNVLTITPSNLSHTSGAGVYEIGFGFWARLELPTTFISTDNFYDVSLNVTVDSVSR